MTAAQAYATYKAATAAAATTTDKGDVLAAYIQNIFSAVDGVQVHDVKMWNDARSSEIDVMLWNERTAGPNGLDFLPSIVLVEAKNWTHAVGSSEVAWFKEKVLSGGDYSLGPAAGILVSPEGVTGQHDDSRFAAAIILDSRREVRLLVVSPGDIALEPPALRELLRTRLCDLAAGRAGLP